MHRLATVHVRDNQPTTNDVTTAYLNKRLFYYRKVRRLKSELICSLHRCYIVRILYCFLKAIVCNCFLKATVCNLSPLFCCLKAFLLCCRFWTYRCDRCILNWQKSAVPVLDNISSSQVMGRGCTNNKHHLSQWCRDVKPDLFHNQSFYVNSACRGCNTK